MLKSIMARLCATLTKPRKFKLPSLHDCVHKGEHFAHMTYLGCVFVEAHGWYGRAAGFLLVFTVTSLFLHDDVGIE